MSGYYCALDCVISGRLGYVRRYPPRFSCGRVEAHNKSEPVTCTLPTPVEETSQLLFDVTLLQGGYVTVFFFIQPSVVEEEEF